MCIQEAAYTLGTKLLRQLPPEFSHDATHFALKNGFGPRFSKADAPELTTHVFGRKFSNPIGLAAGFDKNAHIIPALFNLGFGFVEVGTITQFPQQGNPHPRLFRVKEHKALINRMGFNNQGMKKTAKALEKYFKNKPYTAPVGINFGFKAEPDGTDKLSQITALANHIKQLGNNNSYFVLNISCPNVVGGRDSQFGEKLQAEVSAVRDILGGLPFLVKTGPDLTFDTMDTILDIILDVGVDGLIISNTMPNNKEHHLLHGYDEQGGLSGAPIFKASTALLAHAYKQTKGSLPLIGLGGVMTGADAYEKIKSGASLVQIYTGLIYQGPAIVKNVKHDLFSLLKQDGFTSIEEAIGYAVQ